MRTDSLTVDFYYLDGIWSIRAGDILSREFVHEMKACGLIVFFSWVYLYQMPIRLEFLYCQDFLLIIFPSVMSHTVHTHKQHSLMGIQKEGLVSVAFS